VPLINQNFGDASGQSRGIDTVCGLLLDKLAADECAKSLETLTRLACNPECISTLVDGLVSSLTAILDVAEHQDGTTSGFDRLVRCLLNQIVKVSRVGIH